jgi:diguanylate cyclase (GGDEF)-like protein
MKVLLAEDSLSLLLSTKAMIEAEGHTVVTARDGKEALLLFKEEQPDLVILDIMMPQIDGYEVAAAIRTHLQDDWIPIIFLSGSNECEDIAKGIRIGADDYVTKPVSKILLNAKLSAMQRIADMRQRLVSVTQDLENANNELQAISFRDVQTGIASRRHFEEALEREWGRAQRLQSPIGLVIADLDHFKKYNDQYGRLKGDECLAKVAMALQGSARRPTDLVARYGGEEFAVILPETDEDGGMHVAEGLNMAVWRLQIPHAESAIVEHVTLSVGCASHIPVPGEDVQLLIAAADEALYEAKRQGRNRSIRASAIVRAA